MMRSRWLAPAVLAAAALTAAACGASAGSGGSGSPGSPAAGSAPAASSTAPAAAGTMVSATKIRGAMVLTDAKGFTLYWFAPDTPTSSKCNGSCATFWPPVKGPVTGGSGVTGKLGTITRPDGSTQATYNGHPLYTYAGDHSPGQATGNGLNVSGGAWHEVTVSGAAVPASSPMQSSGGGGYGGGY